MGEKMAPLGPGKVTARIEDYLDLMATSTRDSELYQVANYGIAGQYDVHIDQVMMSNDASSRLQKREVFNIYAGDRLATIMGYLSDVPLGGNTVFPTIGGYDWRVRHGGCPVMVGSKWITNKWIRANSQMWKRPCPKYTNKQLRKFRSVNKYHKGDYFAEP